MSYISKLIKRVLASRGFELCRLSNEERQQLPTDLEMNYKEAQCFRALSNMGQISLEEARLLGELVQESDSSRPIIEIGTLFGFSATVIALFKEPGQELLTVDNFSWNPLGLSQETHQVITVKRLTEACANHRTSLVISDKEAFYQSYKGPVPSLFFCDANHSYEATYRDIEWAKSVGASIICGDDYDLGDPSPVQRAVAEHGGASKVVGGLFVL